MRFVFTILLVFALFFTVISGGILHSVIPHSHNHGSEAIWNSFHSALRHEDKQLFAAVVNTLVLLIGIVAIAPVMTFSPVLIPADRESRLLRRGIHKYRRFR